MKKKEGFMNQNYRDFKVLSIISVYQNFPINWVEKKNTWHNKEI